MLGDPPFGFLLGAEFADAMLAPVGHVICTPKRRRLQPGYAQSRADAGASLH
jgi:hypothetical protein